MKIGIDGRTLLEGGRSGIPNFSYNLIKNLLNTDISNEYSLFYNSFKKINPLKFESDNYSNLELKYPNKLLNWILFNFLDSPKIDDRLKSDLFYMPHFNFIGLGGKSKKVLTIHDLSFIKYPEFFSIRKNIWHRMVNAISLIKKFDKVIAMSENTKRDLIELTRIKDEKVEVVYPGLPYLEKTISSNIFDKYNLPKNYILYFGTLEPRKNIEGIVRSFELFLKQYPDYKDVHLVLAGCFGWKYKNIKKTILNSAVGKNIMQIGFVDDEDKYLIFKNALVFIYPSFYEGFGFPPLEAMECGVPVIASHNSSLPEILGDSAHYVNPYNNQDIAKSIEIILSNPTYRLKLVKNGYRNTKQFTWKKTSEKYIKIFNSL